MQLQMKIGRLVVTLLVNIYSLKNSTKTVKKKKSIVSTSLDILQSWRLFDPSFATERWRNILQFQHHSHQHCWSSLANSEHSMELESMSRGLLSAFSGVSTEKIRFSSLKCGTLRRFVLNWCKRLTNDSAIMKH